MSVIGAVTITYSQIAEFTRLYDSGHYGSFQRFGQAFCNHFNIVWPELFYIESRKEAEIIIYSIVK